MTTQTANFQNSILKQKTCKCGTICNPVFVPAIPAISFAERWVEASDVCKKCFVESERADFEKRFMQAAVDKSGLGPKYLSKTFDNFVLSDALKPAFDAAKNFDKKQSLLLIGDCGSGKTHLAAAVVNKFITQGAFFISCPELLENIRKNFKAERSVDILDFSKKSKILVLDDLGAEKTSEWAKEILFLLIDFRNRNNLPVIITTNFSIEQIFENLGQRIASRIVEMCKIIKINAPDYRLGIRKNLNVKGAA